MENHWLKCLKAPYLNVMMIYFFSNLQSAISQKMCTVSCCLNLKWNQVVVNEAGSWLGLTKVSSFKSRWFFKPVLCSRCAWDVGNVAGDVGISAYPRGISPAALLKLSTFLFLSKSLIALIVTYMSKLECSISNNSYHTFLHPMNT